jgi:ABC-type Fe3+ transport system substrate-binding protein
MKISGEENLKQIAEINEKLIPIFERHGLGSYFKPENLGKIGRFMKLSTLLKSKKIDVLQFIELLNNSISTHTTLSSNELRQVQGNLHFVAMLPCGLRNPFKEYFESLVQDNPQDFGSLNYLIEGNVNHELSYYPLLDSIEDINELPDIIMASDVNNFYHRPFMEKFIAKGIFSTFSPYVPNPYLEKAGYNDTKGNFTMFTANMLVIVVDKDKLANRRMPEKWSDLLDTAFKDDIIMRGEDNFFCNAVMLPFYKDNGFNAIKKLALNIHSGMHPAEMVKLAGSGKEEGRTVYIMPYFFSKRIKKKNVEIIWPEDGAIASPVFLLIKKDKIDEHKPLLDLLTNINMGNMLQGRFFPAMHPDVPHRNFPEPVKWLGWDFLYNNDIGRLKEDIREVFMKIWVTKN